MNTTANRCCFCGSDKLKLMYSGLYHPYKKDHGPFDFYKCRSCGSGLTFPIPTSERIGQLYATFSGGLIPSIKTIRDNNPLTTWYKQCIKRATDHLMTNTTAAFTWLDVGAGSGELSHLMSEQYPCANGTAVDFHDEPSLLRDIATINWVNTDLDSAHSLTTNGIADKYDLVFLITVLEHIRQPEVLVDRLLKKLKPGGCLYITVPDYGSWAALVLGKRWPYFLPGEHLCIPTIKGMKMMLNKICFHSDSMRAAAIDVKSAVLPYTLGYYFNYFGVKRVPSLFLNTTLRFPTGILEAAVVTPGTEEGR